MATPAAAVKRLQQDLKRLREEPIVGAMAQPASDKDIMVWHGIVVGTEGTSLSGIPIRFCLEFPNDYPNSAPDGFFETKIFYKDGAQVRDNKGRIAVCLNIFGNFARIHTEWKSEAAGWSPAYTVSTILVSLQALVMENMFSNRPSDIEQMISSALNFKCPQTGHDGSNPTKWFPQVINDPTVVAEMIKQHKERNPKSNTPLEMHYICYANGQLNGNNSSIGYGVHVENTKKGQLSSPCEYLSKECFMSGTRKSSTNKPFKYWLPILINSEDWGGQKKVKIQFLKAVQDICQEIKFVADDHVKVFKVCSSLMNSLVVEIMKNKDNVSANDKFIHGYFAIYRLLNQYAMDSKKLVSFSNDALKLFVEQPQHRIKNETSNLGEFLMHLTIATSVTWKDICQAFMGECDARNVFWYCADNKAPHKEFNDLNFKGERVTKVFDATMVSRNLVMFQIKFANVTNFLDMVEFDTNYGLAPEGLIAELKNLYSQVVAVKDWNEFYGFVEMPKVGDEIREKELIDAVKRSAAQGYHKIESSNAGIK